MGSQLEKNSSAVRKRIHEHTFTDEDGEEYEGSTFGGFGDYFRRKKLKLQNLDADLRASSEKPQIFKGIVAHVSGYTQPPLHVLHKELVLHGAGFLQYLDSKTMATHIIASSLTPKKAVEFNRYRIVKPAWVTESIKAGKQLPWNDFRVLDDGPRQKTIKLDAGKMISQNTQQSPKGYREQTQNSFYTSQFQKKQTEISQANSSPFAHSASPSTLRAMESIEDDEMDVDLVTAAQEPRAEAESPPEEYLQEQEGDRLTFEENPAPVDDDIHKMEAQAPSNANPMTSEEHNAWLLSDPKIRKSSTANPNFLKQFYAESRLHHLSTWKAELKSKMQRLAAEKGLKGLTTKGMKRRPGSRRYIMHVDFDSFFCAVSLKRAPEYVDKPAVVAHSEGLGSEIASCNYPARKFGVKNGMWMKTALERCPELKVLPYDFPAYEVASGQFYEAILDIDGIVQSVSVDEALLDVSSLVLSSVGSDGVVANEHIIQKEQDKANSLATNLRQKIKHTTGCNVSIGVGANVLLAKVALRRAKPAGQYQVKPEEVLDVLGDLEVRGLPGVAHSISGKLEEIGVKLVKDVRGLSKERLISVLGPKTGIKLWEYSRGIDQTELGEQPVRKSVSAEVSWGIRFINQEEAEEFVLNLCKELEKRLLNEQVKGRNLTMKIMRRCLDAPLDPVKHLGHGNCDTFNKSVVFGVATNSGDFIGKEAVSILRAFKFSPGDLRGIGVQLQKLEPIKTSAAAPDGSQKRLSFHSFAPTSAKKVRGDAIEDDAGGEKRKPTPRKEMAGDPIADDPLTPRKPKIHAGHPALALARAGEADTKATTPLNTAGTQFILPPNPDPAVLAALPNDIRSRLKAQRKQSPMTKEKSPSLRSRTQSPALQTEIPPEIDPEVFNALPDDMKAEVLASYGRPSAQTRLPQSPRRDRATHPPAAKKTPTKRGGLRGMWSKARSRQHDAEAGLLQTNFVTNKKPRDQQPRPAAAAAADNGIPDLDSAFLAELPADVRKELVDDHRRRQLAARSGLGFQAPPRRAPEQARGPVGGPRLQFPALPPKAKFTASALSSFGEVKDMLGAWHKDTAREGPHEEDVVLFAAYLARVVVEEKNMDKARKLLLWLDWVVEEEDQGPGKVSWRERVVELKEMVQKAMKARGLGPMKFG